MTKNEFIEIPDYNPDILFYIKEVYLFIDGIQRESSTSPIIFKYTKKQADNDQYRYWAKFIFKTSHEDPLAPLWSIKSKYPKLNYKKFISEKVERFTPQYIPVYFDELYYRVEYLEIREPLLTYLRSKVQKDDIKFINKLQFLFSHRSSKLTWDEFLKRKAEFLSQLDLSNYVAELNLQTNKKRAIRINKNR